jgi:phosphatidylserine decarboxylase
VRWLSERYFFRDPLRSVYCDPAWFFAPADGVILYAHEVEPADPLVEIKGRPYSLRDALREPDLDRRCLVIGIFMSFYDVHVNRVPYAGFLSYKELDPIDSYNHPMLAVELGLVDDGAIRTSDATYLHNNQRVVNTIHAPRLGLTYQVLQVADFDVDAITPFELKQNRPFLQNERFSQIRYGSQVDLIVPVTGHLDLEVLHGRGMHVEAGVDPLVRVTRRDAPAPRDLPRNDPPGDTSHNGHDR